MDIQLQTYIAHKKRRLAEAIAQEKRCLSSMESHLAKLNLNDHYGKEYMGAVKEGIERQRNVVKALKMQYDKTPILRTLEEILTVIAKEDTAYLLRRYQLEGYTPDTEKDLASMIALIENIEFKENLRIETERKTPEGFKNAQDKNIELPVDGYLLCTSLIHTPEFSIISFESSYMVEREILSGRGLNNMFTFNMIVLYNGELKKYHITNKKGTVLNKHQIEGMSDKTASKLNVVWED
ncbi:MAG: hypothetical protein RSE64_07920 [Oscillospiraceae bacterium]